MDEKFLLIKISERPDKPEDLKIRVSGNWVIKKETVRDVRYMLVTCHTEIIAVYKINSVKESDSRWARGIRLCFDLEETNDYRCLKNRKIVTKTSNPSTILLKSDIVFK